VSGRRWTADQVRALGVRCSVEDAGSILGVSRGVAYELARRDELGVPVLRVGRRMVVPTAPLLSVLHIDDTAPVVAPTEGGTGHDQPAPSRRDG